MGLQKLSFRGCITTVLAQKIFLAIELQVLGFTG